MPKDFDKYDDAAFASDCDAVWHSTAMKALRMTYGFTA